MGFRLTWWRAAASSHCPRNRRQGLSGRSQPVSPGVSSCPFGPRTSTPNTSALNSSSPTWVVDHLNEEWFIRGCVTRHLLKVVDEMLERFLVSLAVGRINQIDICVVRRAVTVHPRHDSRLEPGDNICCHPQRSVRTEHDYIALDTVIGGRFFTQINALKEP